MTEEFVQRQSPSVQIGNDPLGSVSDSALSVGTWDYAPFLVQSPSLASPTGRFSPATRNGHQRPSISTFPNSSNAHFVHNVPMTAGSDPSGLRVNNLTSSDDSSERSLFLPSLREIRELNSTPKSPPSSIFDISRPDHGEPAENNGRILLELQAFFSTIVSTQAEMAGISSAVAEYLAWVRKVPGMPGTPNCAAILDILETRVRELHEMAESRHWAAWRQALEKLDVNGTDMGMFETEMQNRTAETSDYFHVGYDIRRTLQEQRPGPPSLI